MLAFSYQCKSWYCICFSPSVSLSLFLLLSSLLFELLIVHHLPPPLYLSFFISLLLSVSLPPPFPPILSLCLFFAPVLSFSLQAAREKESSQAQLKALSQQTEAARRELAEILGRLAQREEELRRKDVELSETRQRQLSLEQEIQEVWG